MKTIHGQPSWHIASRDVAAHVTELGGQIAPVTFDRRERKITPYSVAPWAEEKLDSRTPAIIRALRGDFFCAPFGGNATAFRGEQHPLHGESANARWKFESQTQAQGVTTLHLSLKTKIRPGRIDKGITLVDGENIIYSRHTLTGMTGPMNLGHHAMLKFPDRPGSGNISTSPFLYGQVFPSVFEEAEKGGYQSLKMGAEFKSLQQVPLATGGTTDLSVYPARKGFEDLVMIVNDTNLPFAWTAVTFPQERYVWFALKNPHVLRETIFWLSNRGRHYAPWSGRHESVLGIEDVTAYFHYGLAESARPNPISKKGWPTALHLHPRTPLVVNYIMGVAKIPAGFDRVASIEPSDDNGSITLKTRHGRKATARVDLNFLV